MRTNTMNGKFEHNSSYPYSVQPEGGYGRCPATGLWEVIDIRDGSVLSSGHADAVAAARAIPVK